jgi:membrane protease YdiL (CAAX protease family)
MFAKSVLQKRTTEWKARDGVLCALVLIVVSIVTNSLLRSAYSSSPTFANWFKAHDKPAQAVLLLIHSFLWVLTVFVLAKIRSKHDFATSVGLRHYPTMAGWIAAWLALCISILAIYGVTKQWIPPNQFSRGFHYEGGTVRVFFICYAVLIAPLAEEIVMRGCMYRAFRGRYGIYISLICVLFVHGYFHWGIISKSFYTYICLISIECLLCAVLEYTGNVWNCVLCHSTYNSVQNLPLLYSVIGLVLMLPIAFLLFRRRHALAEKKG